MEITAEQAAQALNVSRSTITIHAKALMVEKRMWNSRLSTVITPRDFLNIAKRIDALHESTEKQALAKRYIENVKSGKNTLSAIQQEHPLVKNPKMFITGWFPAIDSYEFLTECNTVRNSGSD